jgi:hypothetical protein
MFNKGGVMFAVHAYVAYLILSLGITIWVARMLHQNGRVFLVDAFHGKQELADSVNKLLVVGFYLINIGWAVSALQTSAPLDTVREVIELLSSNIGTILLVLGGMHFLNLYVLNRFRRNGLERYARPPLPPDAMGQMAR